MIQLYTGVPGSGKTFKMVLDLDKFLKKNPDIILICNITSLKFEHINFEEFILECFPLASLTDTERIECFFSYDFQDSLNKRFGGPVFYILDECQDYFPQGKKLPKTEGYLQRHRHLGHYIYLATQNSKLIDSKIVPLIETEINAVRRSFSLFGEFHYRRKSPQSNTVFGTVCHRQSKRIFELYKSFSAEEIERPKRTLWLKLWPVLLIVFFGYLFYERMYGDVPVSVDQDINYIQTSNSDTESMSGFSKSMFDDDDSDDPEFERIFLIVVDTAEQYIMVDPDTGAVNISNIRLVIDPDTGAVTDIRNLIDRNVSCPEPPDGLICFYDRPYNSGVTIASYPDFAGTNSKGKGQTMSKKMPEKDEVKFVLVAGEGNFVDADLVLIDDPSPESSLVKSTRFYNVAQANYNY